ncbi:hypothetical protein JCM10207_007264 [Rhodosporidiobolus poonsookiae]
MPEPSLPLDVQLLVLEHLVEPVALERPSFYADLRNAALVCRDWTAAAQKLLLRHVIMDRGDEQARKWFAVDPSKRSRVETVVLLDRPSRIAADSTSWSPDVLHALSRLELAYPYERTDRPPSGLAFSNLSTLVVLRTSPYVSSVPSITLLRCIDRAAAAGAFPRLHTLETFHLSAPLPHLASRLRTLHIHPQHVETPISIAFIRVCSQLEHLIFDRLTDHLSADKLPSSLQRLTIRRCPTMTMRYLVNALFFKLERLPALAELRIGDVNQQWMRADLVEPSKRMQRRCEERGIRLVMMSEEVPV